MWRLEPLSAAVPSGCARRTASSAPPLAALRQRRPSPGPVVAPQQVRAAASSSPTPAKFALHATRDDCPSASTRPGPVGHSWVGGGPRPRDRTAVGHCWSILGTQGVGGRHGHYGHPRSPSTDILRPTSTWWASTEGSATDLRCGVARRRVHCGRRRVDDRPQSGRCLSTSNRSTGSWPRTVLTGWASASWPISIPRPSHGTWTWFLALVTSDQLPRTATAPSWAPLTKDGPVLMCRRWSRRRYRSQAVGPNRGKHPAKWDGPLSMTLRRRLRRRLPSGHRLGPVGQPLPRPG